LRSEIYQSTKQTKRKANSDKMVTVDEEVSNDNDIQGSEENGSHEQQQSTAKTNNSIF
jgi:hypothetical protein